MSGTVDIKRALLAVMAAAALVVVLAVPSAQAADDCSAAGTDPTAAQYCPPTEPECVENGAGGSPSTGTNSENCEEAPPPPVPPSSPPSSASSGGSLPFTGADVIALLAVAAGFIAVGLALQRLSRSDAEPS
jgi:hypothetical protein